MTLSSYRMLQAYPVEIYPYTLRSRGLSLTLIMSTLGLITGNQVNPIAMKAIAWKYYLVFCCILACLVVVIYFLFPETRGHTLEEIREIFEGKPDASAKDVEEAATTTTSDGAVDVEDAQRGEKKSSAARHVESPAAA